MRKMTGKELVAFARSKIGIPYVYGAKGKIVTENEFNALQRTYGKKYVPDSDRKKIGKVCVDCSGLISWACGYVTNSKGFMQMANEKHSIKTLEDAPVGALVWMEGHIGIYSGMKNGVAYYIAADGSKYGVREVPINQNRFTHWLLVNDLFTYEIEEDEMVVKDTIIVNGKEYKVNMIRKDGTTFIKTRDMAEVLGMKVSSKGKIPVLDK